MEERLDYTNVNQFLDGLIDLKAQLAEIIDSYFDILQTMQSKYITGTVTLTPEFWAEYGLLVITNIAYESWFEVLAKLQRIEVARE